MSKSDFLRIVCAEGEGQKIEFKAKTTALAKEIVAFANASGGSLFLGISDDGEIIGIDDSNRLRSQIQDVANGCDPRIDIRIAPRGNVVEIIIPEVLINHTAAKTVFSCVSALIRNSLPPQRPLGKNAARRSANESWYCSKTAKASTFDPCCSTVFLP